ncbi:beta strand repeat-containing protein [Advenella sp. FME57]|uniref:beta strand repeat-containing protein n=1 Tax=Advenella sp. FME57 TaxID=2742604 RepID=UPI00351C5CD6
MGGQRGVTYQAQSLTKAEGSGSIALGGGARATADRAVALGERAQATRADAVALGSASNTNAAATAINNATVGGHAYTEFAGVVSNPNRVLSVGAAGAERQIKNVGSGEISATSTDAVNGSQLYAIASRQGGGMNFSGDANTNGSTVENDRKVEIPSSGNLNITGGVTNPANLLNDQIGVVADPAGKTLNVRLRKDLNLGSDGSLNFGTSGPNLSNIGLNMNNKKITGLSPGTAGTDAVNVSQLNGVKATADNAMTEVSKGWNLQANGDAASKVAPGNTVQFIDGANIDITRQGNNVTIATSSNLTADSLRINNQGPVLNATGIAMGGKKITGLADGTAPNDAVNFSQLDGVKSRADNALIQAGNALIQAHDAFTEASKGWNLQANGDAASKVAPGNTVQFIDGANIDITRQGSNVTVATSPALTADSLTINNRGPVLNANGIAMGSKKITGLADGAAPNDAVNFSQLDGVKSSADNALTQAGNAIVEASKGWNLQANGDTATKVAPGDTVQFIDGNNINVTRNGKDLTIATASNMTADSLTINNGGPIINAGGINMGGKKITGLADGTAPTDAVSFSQLNGVKAVADNAMAEASKGFNLQTNGDTAAKVAPGDTVQFINGTNIGITRAGNDITIATAADLTADSLTINNGGPVFNVGGINMGGKKLTGLADGTAPNDAVNFSQLDGVKVVADDALTQAGSAIVQASKGWNLQANGDVAAKVAPGDTVQFINGANIDITRAGNDITIATAADLTADSLTINNGGPVLNAGGIDMGGKKITGLVDGTGPTDAVSFSQLDGVKTVADNAMAEASKGFNLQTNGDTATKVAPGDTVQFIDGNNINVIRNGNDLTIATSSDLTADSLTINNGGPVLNAGGIDMGGKKITGLADGTAPTDAVSFSQLDGVKTVVDSAMVEASKGFNLQVNGDTATKVSPGDTVQFIDGANIDINRAGNDITITTAADLTADSLTINNGGPALNADGIVMGGKKITGLADGAAPNDAVNFSQLDGVKSRADDALTQAGNALTEASKGWNLQANGDTATKVAPGDTVQFIDGTNIDITRVGNDITIATAADLTADSLAIPCSSLMAPTSILSETVMRSPSQR